MATEEKISATKEKAAATEDAASALRVSDSRASRVTQKQGGLTIVYKTEIFQNLVHHESQCLYTYISAGVL